MNDMKLRKIFGSILTMLGVAGLIYSAFLFSDTADSNQALRLLLVYGIISLLFFFAGISLIKTTNDEV